MFIDQQQNLNGFFSRRAMRAAARKVSQVKPPVMAAGPQRGLTKMRQLIQDKVERKNAPAARRFGSGRMFFGRRWPYLGGNDYEHLSGLGLVQAGTIPPPADSGSKGTILDSLTSIFQTAIPAYSQYKLMQTNVDLIKQGKAPLDAASIAPTVRVQAGLAPGATSMVRYALIGTGALLGGMLLLKALKR